MIAGLAAWNPGQGGTGDISYFRMIGRRLDGRIRRRIVLLSSVVVVVVVSISMVTVVP